MCHEVNASYLGMNVDRVNLRSNFLGVRVMVSCPGQIWQTMALYSRNPF